MDNHTVGNYKLDTDYNFALTESDSYCNLSKDTNWTRINLCDHIDWVLVTFNDMIMTLSLCSGL